MFTKPPTPEEFLELRRQKFQRKEDEATAEIVANNKAQVNQIIKAMRRGDDLTEIDGRLVGNSYRYGVKEKERFCGMVVEAFPLFVMIIDASGTLPVKYKVRWTVKDV